VSTPPRRRRPLLLRLAGLGALGALGVLGALAASSLAAPAQPAQTETTTTGTTTGVTTTVTTATTVTTTTTALPKPANTSPPTVSGTAQVGATLTGNRGDWSNNPSDYNYFWLRCDNTGGSCAAIGGANGTSYKLTSADVGNTLRFRVEASNSAGSTTAASVPTAVVKAAATPPPPPAPAPTGCPSGSGTIGIANLAPPARLLVDRIQFSPSVVGRNTGVLVARFHVVACSGRAVQGALVYATAVPFNQLSIPGEAQTGADGWAQLELRTLRGFPVSPVQQLIAIFVRARKSGENLLGGVSTRRLVSVHVRLR
jgi:hypothetical protein